MRGGMAVAAFVLASKGEVEGLRDDGGIQQGHMNDLMVRGQLAGSADRLRCGRIDGRHESGARPETGEAKGSADDHLPSFMATGAPNVARLYATISPRRLR